MVHPDKCKHPRAREAFEGAPLLRSPLAPPAPQR
jgi:hypothetical protein